jgi:nucleoside-diphosphate-sugar epimerase
MCRKVAVAKDGNEIEVWGDGEQTRSFLYIDECIEAVQRLMNSNFREPVNIGSEEMVSINELAKMVISISDKKIKVRNIEGAEFEAKYGFKCPLGVRGRNSDNNLYENNIGWKVSRPLKTGVIETYKWISKEVMKAENITE